MEPKEITSWHMTSGIGYEIHHHNEEDYFIWVSKRKANKLLYELFASENDDQVGLESQHIWKLWKIGAVRSSQYAKNIIDTCISGILSLPIAAIALFTLAEASGEEQREFITERLVGKKRLEYWQNHLSRYHVKFEDPTYFAIFNMWGNESEELTKFIEEHRKRLNTIINDCEY